jgi:magnesium-transporting ATPase (P-type)
VNDIEITCELPNKDLYKFDGKLSLPSVISPNRDAISLSNDNLLLRGMSLRNTEFVYGITVYTGPETKIQKNSLRTKYKISKIMHQTNSLILVIFIVQIFLSSLGAYLGTRWMMKNMDNAYLDFIPHNKWDSDW